MAKKQDQDPQAAPWTSGEGSVEKEPGPEATVTISQAELARLQAAEVELVALKSKIAAGSPMCPTCEKEAIPDPDGKHECARCRSKLTEAYAAQRAEDRAKAAAEKKAS
jgi:GH24 family phage-related lysozyme (muramidase)